jgi:superfamily II DNA or RNA helicase
LAADLFRSAERAWEPGDRLTLRGADWVVVRHTRWADCETVHLDPVGDARARTFLLPFDRPHRTAGGRLAMVSPAAWLHALERALVEVHPFGGLRHCPTSIDLIPYQLEPALATLRHGHTRLLIADDVGMGKTIEAGLILRELSARQDGVRALILVPAGLRQQWIDQLASHFGMSAVNADASWLRAVGRSLPPDLNPWSPPGTYIASFDFIKRPEALRPLETLQWDLVVVDEAHAATVATDRRAAIDAIAHTARRVVLLTATPPADALQFAALCRIGSAGDEEDTVLFQRSSRPEQEPGRRSIVLVTRLSEEERRLHRLLERYTMLVWREARRLGNPPARLATIVLRKRALSSAASLALSLRRRMELLAGLRPPEELQLLLPLADADDDGRDEVVSDELLGAAGLTDLASEQRWLNAVLDAALAVTIESKARVLVRLLKRLRQPAVVFTEYRDTLEQLRAHLHGAGLAVSVLHGGLSAGERRDALASISRGDATLVATDAAAEGLNLQHACRIVIHFELPWNPVRMLQRAGRVDRLGQRHRVHEIALVASDTAEALVLAPLARRASGRAGGGGRRMLQLLTESRVAQSVFERRPCDLPVEPPPAAPCVHVNLAAESTGEVQRLASLRQFAPSAQLPTQSRFHLSRPATIIRRTSLAAGVVLLFDLKVISSNGALVEHSLTALHLEMTVTPWSGRPRQIRQELARHLPALLRTAAPTLDRLVSRQLEGVRGPHHAADQRMRRRERSMMRVTDSAATRLVQAGLFDRPMGVSWAARQPQAAGLLESGTADDRSATLTASADLRAVILVPVQ